MNREARIQSAPHWLKTFSGRDVVRGYRKWYGVSTVCAILEVRMLGIVVSAERLAQAQETEEETARQRARRLMARAAEVPEDSNDFFGYLDDLASNESCDGDDSLCRFQWEGTDLSDDLDEPPPF